ncbi:hypothetical protein RJ55_05247 [Drechmeria coniospora]|nr:hypothetical protein RJ55_05247 [Drechmeria coniospora]
MAIRPSLRTCTALLINRSSSSSSVALTRRSAPCPYATESALAPAGGQRRRYAVPRAPRVGTSYSEVFTLSDISQEALGSIISRSGNVDTSLSAEECYEYAGRFSQAIKDGSSPWAVSLGGGNAESARMLHQVACIMRQIHGSRSADAFAMAMWASASELGHRPATLSLARQLIRSGAFGRMPQLRKVEARFKQMVSTGKDPDALTAEGELLFEQGSFDAAVTTLRRALRLATGSFEWKAYCRLCLGKSLLKLGKREEALKVFEALSESGFAEAHMEIGMMLRSEDRDKATRHLYAAACGGRQHLFSHLSEMALEEADGRSPEDSQRWAVEWSRLADPRVDY